MFVVNRNATLPMIYILLGLTPPIECHLQFGKKIYFKLSKLRLQKMKAVLKNNLVYFTYPKVNLDTL